MFGPLIVGVAGAAETLTDKVTGVPVPHDEVSVTLIVPPLAPKFTLILLVPCPDAIVAPPGTTQL
jgi:hypothetical protein